jgi:Cd2+/Zn2+-exporting ATPase
VLEGTSSLNTAALTGESLPRDVTAGDEVISGCVNESGLIRVRAEKTYGDSTVARILDLVENAAARKAKTEAFITRFAKIYTPLVCALALLLFLVPSFLLGGDWRIWGERALSFLVVSCPCALVISVPRTFFGGIGGASRNGILVKGSNYLEQLADARIVVFDKTGTLTRGSFTVTVVHPDKVTEQELLKLAATVESYSDHPISRSIRAHYHLPVDADGLKNVREMPGLGVTAELDGRTVYAGNEKLMDSIGVTPPVCPHVGTVVHVAQGGQYLGHIVISDEVKPDAKEAVAALGREGVRKTVMLTGDAKAVADHVAGELGLTEAYASLLPADKVEKVESLLAEAQGKDKLVFVGDGINDARVLTRADVGGALGALGSDAAVEAADVVLMDDDPMKLPLAMRIAKHTLSIARQNIAFALGVKVSVLALVAVGLAGMWLAVFADVGVSLLAILNATRALKTPAEPRA